MEHLIAILVALLGSGAISSIIAVIMYRWRHDKYVNHLESWKNEQDLLKSLEDNAGIPTSEGLKQSRDLAIATAARTQINSAIAARLIPQNQSRFWLLSVGGILLGLMGLFFTVSGAVYALPTTEISPRILFGLVAFAGLVMIVTGSAMVFIALKWDLYRDVMRAEVQRVLNDAEGNLVLPSEALAIENCWLPGDKPNFTKRLHKLAIPPDVRQAFSYFMMNINRHSGQTERPGLASDTIRDEN